MKYWQRRPIFTSGLLTQDNWNAGHNQCSWLEVHLLLTGAVPCFEALGSHLLDFFSQMPGHLRVKKEAVQ